MKLSWKCIAPVLLMAVGCVKTDPQLGRDLIDSGLLYDTYTVEFPLTEVENRKSEDLSAYSNSRVTLGAIRDDVFGLTTRSSAFTLIPALDTLDFGDNPTAVKFMLHLACDTVSVADPAEANILQNVYVHALTDSLRTVGVGTCTPPSYSSERITLGTPVINGTDSLSFEFTQAFAQKYIDGIRSLCVRDSVLIDRGSQAEDKLNAYLKERMKAYVKVLPGVFVETDKPAGVGGRFCFFDLSCLSVVESYYSRNNNVAMLTMHSTWKGVAKDSTFLFLLGEPAFYDETQYLIDNERFYQYAYNYTGHESANGKATDKWMIEGGGGLKPVITAKEMREKTLAEVAKVGASDRIIINKASIIMPFEMPADYMDLSLFPSMLSPTIRTTTSSGSIQFAGLTDASDSSENQGNIDQSNLQYAPDVSYHLQEILRRSDTDDLSDADVWLLTVHSETTENATGSIYDNEYYQQLMYASYYNSLYGYDGYGYGGYGYGYGGYGGYGYGGYGGYSNYYNYLMMAQMMAEQSSNSVTTTSELDKDRYYRGILNGPAATTTDAYTHQLRVPRFRVTFSVPKR